MEKRLDQCRAKGSDAVEPDNINSYSRNSGFNLTANDQLTFNIWLANAADNRGLSIGLKEDPDQVTTLVAYYD